MHPLYLRIKLDHERLNPLCRFDQGDRTPWPCMPFAMSQLALHHFHAFRQLRLCALGGYP
jgi:hypothetical protein